MLVKINKNKAERLFKEGKKITLVPCKLRIGAPWHPESRIKRTGEAYCNFQSVVNAFIYYNCSSETGYYPHYYIEQ